MKAISPALPVPAPTRTESSSAPSAADEAFGAVIAAALGIGQPIPMSQAFTPHQDRDSGESRNTHADRVADRIDPSRDSRVTDARDADSGAGAGATSKPDDANASSSSDGASADAASNTPATHSGTTAAGKKTDGSSTALAVASAALSNALADDAAKRASATDAAAKEISKTQLLAGKAVSATSASVAQNPLLAAAMTAGAKAATASVGAQPTAAPVPGVPADPAALTALVSTPGALAGDAAKSPTGGSPAVAGRSSSASSQVLTATGPQAGTASQAQQKALQPVKPAGNDLPTTPGDASGAGSQNQLTTTSANAHGSAGHHDTGASLSDQNGHGTNGRSDSTAAQPTMPFDSALQAAAPIAPTAPTTLAPQPATPSAPQAAVPQQIVQVLAPLRSAGDGNYTLSLQLHPADLGPVTVHVAVNDGVMSVQLVPDQSHGRDAITGSLSDLRNQLQAGGIRVGDIDVGTKTSLSQQQNGQAGSQGGNQNGQAGQNSGQFSQHNGSQQNGQSPFGQHDPSGYDTNRQPVFSGGSGDHGQQGRSHHPGAGVGDSALSGEHLARAGRSTGSDDIALDVRI